MRERIRATQRRAAGGYAEPQELLEDLRRVEASLREGQGALTAGSDLRDFIRQVEVFGFHFARLDIREHALVHRRALAEIYGALRVCEDYEGLREEERLDAAPGPDRRPPAAHPHRHRPVLGAPPRRRSAPSALCARRWPDANRRRDPDLHHLRQRGTRRHPRGAPAHEGGQPVPRRGRQAQLRVVPLFEAGATLEAAPRDDGARCSRCRSTARRCARSATSRRS